MNRGQLILLWQLLGMIVSVLEQIADSHREYPELRKRLWAMARFISNEMWELKKLTEHE